MTIAFTALASAYVGRTKPTTGRYSYYLPFRQNYFTTR